MIGLTSLTLTQMTTTPSGKNDTRDRAAEQDIREKLMPFCCRFYCTQTASAHSWKSQDIFDKSGFATETF